MTIYRQTPRFVWVTNAERPTHGYPIGSILFDEDDKKFYQWDGTDWDTEVVGGGGGATNLDALTDVDLTTVAPSNGDVLTYTTTGTKWVPAAAPGAGGGITASSVDTLTNKTIDADGTGNSITNIENADIKAAAGIVTSKLADSANFAFINIANTYSQVQTIFLNTGYLFRLYKDTSTVNQDGGLSFDFKNSSSAQTQYATIVGGIVSNTASSESGRIRFQIRNSGSLGSKMELDNTGLLKIGANLRLILSESGLSAARTMTFPDADTLLIGAGTTKTLTNTTIDADGTGNSITNIENADIKAAANIAVSKLAAGTDTYVLTTVSGVPTWASAAAGSFTPENFEYLIYHNGTAYVALNGATGSLHATTSTTDAAAVINAAINSLTNGGKVYLGVGTFLIRTKINVKTKIHIQGSGEGTIIKQDTTQNLAAVIESDSFTTLTGGGTNGGPHSVFISDLVIEGNKANNTSTATDGIRYYGYNWHISNVHIRDCKGRGIYSEWDDDPSAPSVTTSMESYYSQLKIHDCDGDGWLNRGPHDWEGEHITIYDNGGHGYVQEYSAGLYDGGGFVDTMHIYANDGTYGAWIKGGTLHANRLTTESCANSASGVNGIGLYVNGGGVDCHDLWTFGQDKGVVLGSGSPSQISGIRAENNKVLGAEILMNDVKIEGVFRNNNNAGNTAGKGIKIGDAGGGIAVCHIAGYLANHKTTNIDWANASNNGVIITPMICYTNATYPTVLTGSPNLNTCSVSIENHADSTPKDYRFSVVTYDQIQKSLFHRIDGQIITGMEPAATAPTGVGLLNNAQLGGAGTTTHSFDNWEGRLTEFATSTTINTKAGLGHTTGNITISNRRQNPRLKVRVKVPTTAGSRLYVGFSSATAIPASDTPLASGDSGVLIGWDSADTQISYWANDGSAGITNAVAGAGTTISNSWHTYELQFDEVTGACLLTLNNTLVATLTTNIPSTDTALCIYACVQCTAGSAARTIQMGQILLEKDFIP